MGQHIDRMTPEEKRAALKEHNRKYDVSPARRIRKKLRRAGLTKEQIEAEMKRP